jgi:hypothetical protein
METWKAEKYDEKILWLDLIIIKLLTCKIASVRFETGDVPDVNVDNKNPLTPYEQSYSPFYVKQNNKH